MVEIRRLQREDDRSRFSSGEPSLDRHFRDNAGQQQFKHRAGVTYVGVESGVIVGFVTVLAGTVRKATLGEAHRRLPPSALPVLILARMGVSTSHQRAGVGARLLGVVLKVALSQMQACGCVGVVVDAKPAAVQFYEKFDFEWIPEGAIDGTRRGFLSIQTIELALLDG